MNCKVILGRSGDYWFWHCVTCDKEGPSDLDTRSVAEEARNHRYDVLFALQVKSREEGLVP